MSGEASQDQEPVIHSDRALYGSPRDEGPRGIPECLTQVNMSANVRSPRRVAGLKPPLSLSPTAKGPKCELTRTQ